MAGLFAKLTALFEAPEEASAPESSLPPQAVALAALMVQLAKADGAYEVEERAGIEAALDARFGEGSALLEAGESAEDGALDSHQFTRLVKEAYAPDERGALLEDLWEVVLADGARDALEDTLMRQFAALLHVPDREVGLARQRVIARR
ncbi:MAG: TerB family tellurite resistance protein [Pseudomonadota bacterium]